MLPEKLKQLLDFDQKKRQGFGPWIAGVDEVGRGPLAGPVVAAAVILRRTERLTLLRDSKKISPSRRERLFYEILQSSLIGIGRAEAQEIDVLNIYQASRLAMKRAVLALTRTPERLLIDGPIKIDLPISQESIIKGDDKSAAIAAASIVAKVHRDAWMKRLDTVYPGYGFCQHKGYPTAIHLENLRRQGPSPVHRTSFSPVQALMSVEKLK